MNVKSFFKSCLWLAVIIVGTLYLASALSVSGIVAEMIDISYAWPSFAYVAAAVRYLLFAALLLAPIIVLYVFIVLPLRSIPHVDPDRLRSLESANRRVRQAAGVRIALAMCSSCVISSQDLKKLRNAIRRPYDIDKILKEMLSVREAQAKRKSVELAMMAGMTASVSSSGVGDAVGMLFWESRLVYETFRIYGFRPNARATISIWVHVVFASLFSASLEELCELFDFSDLFGGFGVRLLQGGAAAAAVLRCGALSRRYITTGISQDARKVALKEFHGTLKADLMAVTGEISKKLRGAGAANGESKEKGEGGEK